MFLSPSRPRSCAALLAALCLSLLLPSPANAQGKKRFGYGFGGTNGVTLKDNPKFLSLFRSVVANPANSTVRVRLAGKDFALGVIVSEDGGILTQATDQDGKYTVRLRDGKELGARLIGVHQAHNLALLKVEASGLKPVTWTESKVASVGSWLASVGLGDDPIAVGVVGVGTRNVPGAKGAQRGPATNGGFLGIGLANEGPGAVVSEVQPNTAAARAGLKVNDVILAVSGKKIADGETLVLTLGRFKPGDVVKLKVRRGEEEIKLEAKLGKRPANAFQRGEFQNNLGSKLSAVRYGFPTILQHDGVVAPEDCGGPLVDLDGHVIGINICRAGRTETWAVPSEVIRSVLPDLLAGRLPPKQATSK